MSADQPTLGFPGRVTTDPSRRRSRAARDCPDHEVAVIGAGPHGLAAAIHLRRAGIAAHVLGDPMSFWRAMPQGMRLRSNLRATSMVEPQGPYSLSSYMSERRERFGHPVSLQRFIDYGSWVQQRGVPDVDRRSVRLLSRRRGDFLLALDDGDSFSTRRVILACGVAPFAHLPTGFEHLRPQYASHTGDHDDLASFANKRVVVVGAGQSAFESAVLLSERGAASVELIARASEIVFLRHWSPIHFMGAAGRIVYAPTDVGPLWYSRLVATPELFTRLPRGAQDAIAARAIRPACSHFVKERLGSVTVTRATQVVHADHTHGDLRLTLSDHTTRQVDHLLFGTGYRVDLTRYSFLSGDLLSGINVADSYPVLGRGLEASVPGMHIMGAPAARSAGPIMRFVSGSWYGASRVTAAIAGSRRRVLLSGQARRG